VASAINAEIVYSVVLLMAYRISIKCDSVACGNIWDCPLILSCINHLPKIWFWLVLPVTDI